ncbi:MAG: sulfite exporter TauE/SafE family protein [Phycisphaerae bacterium]|nr:sulfite exporter TauE/SafE family protein [Phycisphaerae bacterium]MCZ2401167.1 sulfite exporter TauE/SafE family protein [Phycisphaerae bacterium]
MFALLGTVLLASLAGSLHCVGMCGPLAVLATSRWARGGNPAPCAPTRPLPVVARLGALQAAYHGGRLSAYALLGALAGGLGQALDLAGGALGAQRAAAWLAGATMIVIGLAALAREAGLRLGAPRAPATVLRLLSAGHAAVAGLNPPLRAVLVGLLSALLPCGWLYAFVIVSAGTGHAWTGAIVMAAFWLGTVPALAGVGWGVQRLGRLLGPRVALAMAVVVVLLGVLTISQRLSLPAGTLAAGGAAPGSIAEAAQRAASLDSGRMPCCDAGR